MTTLAERYPDLLDGDNDPELTRVVTDLDTAYAGTAIPQAQRLDATIAKALHNHMGARIQARRPRRPLARAPRPLFLAAVAALVLVAGAGVSAGSPLVDRLFSLFVNSSQQAAWTDRGIDLHLSQTTCGRAMTLQHAYADANRIIIGYTVSGEGSSNDLRLTDADGTVFPPLDAGGSAPEAGVTGNVVTFDAGSVTGRPARLALRLTAAGPVTSGAVPCAQTYDFQFAVPFAGGQALDLHQTLISQGVALTLDRIVVSPLETRVYVQTVGKPVNMPYLADLTVGGHNLASGFNGYSSPPGPVVSDVFSFRSIPDERGAATLTLSWPTSTASAATKQHLTSGPWVFHVTLP